MAFTLAQISPSEMASAFASKSDIVSFAANCQMVLQHRMRACSGYNTPVGSPFATSILACRGCLRQDWMRIHRCHTSNPEQMVKTAKLQNYKQQESLVVSLAKRPSAL